MSPQTLSRRMSPQTLSLLRQLLDGVTLNVGAPDFDDVAVQIIQAKRELAAALADSE